MNLFDTLPEARAFETIKTNHPQGKVHDKDSNDVKLGKANVGDIVVVTGYKLGNELYYSGDIVTLKVGKTTSRWLKDDLDETQHENLKILKSKEQGLPKVCRLAAELGKAMKALSINSGMTVLERDRDICLNFVLAHVGEGKDAMMKVRKNKKVIIPDFGGHDRVVVS
jgi:hypothetical protein